MAKSKKARKKKGNTAVRERKLVSIFTRHMAIASLLLEACEIVDIDTLKVYRNISSRRIRLLLEHRHRWTVLLLVFGRTELGEEYFKCEEVLAATPCLQSQISESLSAEHIKLYDSFNPNHFVSLGWIASPVDIEFDLDKIQCLFTKLGAWDYLAKYESKVAFPDKQPALTAPTLEKMLT